MELKWQQVKVYASKSNLSAVLQGEGINIYDFGESSSTPVRNRSATVARIIEYYYVTKGNSLWNRILNILGDPKAKIFLDTYDKDRHYAVAIEVGDQADIRLFEYNTHREIIL